MNIAPRHFHCIEALDPDYRRRSRFTITFGAAIAILGLGEPSFSSASSVLGSVDLGNPTVIPIAIVAGFLYSVLQLYLTGVPSRLSLYWIGVHQFAESVDLKETAGGKELVSWHESRKLNQKGVNRTPLVDLVGTKMRVDLRTSIAPKFRETYPSLEFNTHKKEDLDSDADAVIFLPAFGLCSKFGQAVLLANLKSPLVWEFLLPWLITALAIPCIWLLF